MKQKVPLEGGREGQVWPIHPALKMQLTNPIEKKRRYALLIETLLGDYFIPIMIYLSTICRDES